MITVHRPPNDFTLPRGRKLYFFVGPIQGAPDWQQKGIGIFEQLSAHNPSVDTNLDIANPRRTYLGGTFDYEDQVGWERTQIRRASRAGGIVVWFEAQDHTLPYEAGRPYAKTSENELFRVLGWRDCEPDINVAVGIDPAYKGNTRYIISSVRDAGLSLHKTLDDTCAAVALNMRR